MVLLPNTGYEGANKVAEKIRLAFDDHSIIEDPVILNITVSIGVCATGEQLNVTMERIYSLADKALYQAKQDGRNCVRDSSLELWEEYGEAAQTKPEPIVAVSPV